MTVGTDVSAKYRGAFCEAKIKTAKRLVKVKVCSFPVNFSEKLMDILNAITCRYTLLMIHSRGLVTPTTQLPFHADWH